MAAQKKSQIASEQPQSATKRRGGCGDGWLAASTQEKAGIRGRVGLQHLHETRLRARAPKGKRAYGKVPRNLKARTPRSDRLDHPPRRYGRVDDPREGATDAAAFEAYVEHFLAPSLCEGQVVVLDGLGAHRRTEKVRELIQARGADLVLLLPSYSPDLNPIEEAFSKIKQLVRKEGARVREVLGEAIGRALAAVTTDNTAGWFAHAGYWPQDQSL
jgi:transposase